MKIDGYAYLSKNLRNKYVSTAIKSLIIIIFSKDFAISDCIKYSICNGDKKTVDNDKSFIILLKIPKKFRCNFIHW